LVADCANEIYNQMTRKQYLAEALTSFKARITHPSVHAPDYSNTFVTRSLDGVFHHYIVMGKHHEPLLVFLQNRLVNGGTMSKLSDWYSQWLVQNQPDQVLKARLVHSYSPERWEVKRFKTKPVLPESAVDIWQRRW